MVVSRLPDGEFEFMLGRTTLGAGVNNYPELRKKYYEKVQNGDKGYMLAWDPVAQEERYRIPQPFNYGGGTLVTAGNLLVQGTMNRTLAIYRADNGEKLWEAPVLSVPTAGPISYSVNGRQYIAVNAGWSYPIVHGLNSGPGSFTVGPAKLAVFALDARGVELPPAPPAGTISPPPGEKQPAEKVAEGAVLFAQFCAACHGQNAMGVGPKDLRFLNPEVHKEFNEVVLGGKFKDRGMVPFNGVLTPEQVDAVHAFVISRGQDDWQPIFRPRPAAR